MNYVPQKGKGKGVRLIIDGSPSAVGYYHSNQIGTTRAMTDDGGDDEQGVVYTAFGERVGGTDHRYGYAGAWGYRSHDDFVCDAPQSPEYEFPYLHVGWRYYDPATGRFLQRDPIGIQGGLNVYEYVASVPTTAVDPEGLYYPTNVGPNKPWLPQPPKRPPGSPGWKLKPRGWVPKPPVPVGIPWWQPAFRFTPGVLGGCAVAFGVGYGAGTVIDYAVGKVTGKKLSDHIGEWMYRICPWCFDWMVFHYEDSFERTLLPRPPDEGLADTDAVAAAPCFCVAGVNLGKKAPASARVSG